MRLEGKVALVIGGSQSLGEAISIEFAEQGAQIIVNSRQHAEPPAVVARLQQKGHTVAWEPGDMSDPASMIAVVERVVAQFGRLDILAVSGSPGGGKPDLFEDMPPEEYARMLNGQLISRMNCLHAAVPAMSKQGYGKVVFITSDAGRTPTPSESLVGTAAAGLMFFTRAVGKELARKGIRVNCIATTLTKNTPIHNYAQLYGEDHVLSKAFAKIESQTPFGMNVPSDIAKTALYLASSDSDQVSGSVISVNGGLSFP